MIRSKNALRHGNCFAQQRLGFFEAIYPHKGVRVVVGCNESSFMFFAVELQTSGIYVSQHAVGFFKPFKRMVRARKIALRDENVFFWCANAPHRSQLGLLLDCGADPLVSDGSALHQAAFFGQTAAVELLLDAGVHVDCSGQPAVVEDPDDPDAPSAEERAAEELSRRQYTPLTWTILYSHYDTAILLLRRGAAFEGPLSLVREGNNHREPGYERVDALLADVEAAGSWAAYAREPRRDAHRQALCSH